MPVVPWRFARAWFTQNFRFDISYAHIDAKDGKPDIWFEGPLYEVTHWELPAIRVYTELMNQMSGRKPKTGWQEGVAGRAALFKQSGIIWSFMGGRRCFSEQVFNSTLGILVNYAQEHKDGPGMSGASWMSKAHQFGARPMGSVAHEYYQIMGALSGYRNANRADVETWYRVYGNDLGYALTDTFTTRSFLQGLSYPYAQLFGAFRQDSGDPFGYVDAVTARLVELGIDPKSKLIVHSNIGQGEESLVLHLNQYRSDTHQARFGMGSIFVDSVGWPPANVVCKNVSITLPDGKVVPTVKLSDGPGKESGDPEEITRCRKILGVKTTGHV